MRTSPCNCCGFNNPKLSQRNLLQAGAEYGVPRYYVYTHASRTHNTPRRESWGFPEGEDRCRVLSSPARTVRVHVCTEHMYLYMYSVHNPPVPAPRQRPAPRGSAYYSALRETRPSQPDRKACATQLEGGSPTMTRSRLVMPGAIGCQTYAFFASLSYLPSCRFLIIERRPVMATRAAAAVAAACNLLS